MTVAADLMAELTRRNVRLWTEADQLRVLAPRGVLTPEIRQQLARHKSDVLALLREQADQGERTLPRVIPDPKVRYDPFPATDIQQAYLVGRTDAFGLGNVSCQARADRRESSAERDGR